MLRKADRLASRDINRPSQGKSVFGTLISMRFLPSEHTKVSVVVSKKVAPTAVGRNRIRRRVYAAVREVRNSLKKPAFIMIMPKKECLSCDIRSINDELKTLFNKAGLS
ncbi:MAG: ribonuclease P protein component [bacterium]|nr:ribonuclease P protein component [bacterium]